MAKKRAKKAIRKTAKTGRKEKFGFSLIFITIFFFAALVQMFYLLGQRIGILIIYGISGNIGILVSAIVVFAYICLLIPSIFFILGRKKIARIMGILTMCQMIVVALWFNLLGILIFYNADMTIIEKNVPYFFINLAIAATIILYFVRSKHAKKVLVK